MQYISDNYLVCADAARLNDAFTYCRDDGSHVLWIDHIVCSNLLYDNISAVTILYDFVTSDHRLLSIKMPGRFN